MVCPHSRQRLVADGDALVTEDRRHRYPLLDGVPILLKDPGRVAEYRQGPGEGMFAEYEEPEGGVRLKRILARLARLGGDHRSATSKDAFEAAIASQPAGTLCLSIGGGPTRAHPNLVNLNLDRFPNVDVVADAYDLPYADASVDAVHCEAVLEHLEFPDRAVAEMFRVLAPGGQIFAATPFLQAFHAYPNHFQNFTLEGHNRLFQRAGFEVLASGACVGPTFAITDLIALYLRFFVPTRPLSRAMQLLALLAALPLRTLDLLVHRSSQDHFLASTVYCHLRKP